MNWESEQDQKVQRVEELIGAYLPAEEGYQRTVLEAMNYSIRAGGKRLRPMMISPPRMPEMTALNRFLVIPAA